ncbi:MAG: cell division protein ZapA [Pseudomonadota bacterium]
MNADRDGIKVVSILGNDYSIKAPEGEQQTLVAASVMLNVALADTKRKYPSLIGDKLLVLAALNLCSQQIELKQRHKQEIDRYQEQVSATVDVIERTLGQS